MKRLLSLLLLASILLLGIALEAKAGNLPGGKTVSYKSGDDTISGFLVTPEGKGPFPAIIVIQEWWGLNDWVKGQAQKLAKEGYVTLAVDLYRGKSATNPEEAHELSRGLPEDRAVGDMLAAIAYLKTLPSVKKDKIGSIGWCMGGGYSLSLAVNSPDIKAAVIYYGRLLTDKGTLKKVNAPIVGFFGEDDKGIPVSSVKKFEADMKTLGKDVSINIYPKAGHAFANDERPSYNAEAAKDSWQKTITFFEKKLKS